MSKKDYCVIAAAIAKARNGCKPDDHGTVDYVAIQLCAALAAEYRGSYSFDRERFLRACQA